MKDVYLLIGGNLGDRNAYLDKAKKMISKRFGQISGSSSIYETEAWGKTNQPAFLNQVIKVASDMAPTSLMEQILDIEKKMGRVRMEKNSERTIDIDILYYGNEVIQDLNLTIPHPRIAERRFVLTPLAEYCPELIDPVTGRSIREMLDLCEDKLSVKKITQ